MRHIALFSQTGSEIANLIDRGYTPDKIIFNQKNKEKINSKINLNICNQILKSDSKNINVLRELFGDPETCYITLHGWLNIIPVEICNEYNIFNGHPGLITKYDFLKGKDPQIKAFNQSLPFIGCVIHKVIPGVDEGEIVLHREVLNNCKTLDDMFNTLKDISLNLWIDFFNHCMYNN